MDIFPSLNNFYCQYATPVVLSYYGVGVECGLRLVGLLQRSWQLVVGFHKVASRVPCCLFSFSFHK